MRHHLKPTTFPGENGTGHPDSVWDLFSATECMKRDSERGQTVYSRYPGRSERRQCIFRAERKSTSLFLFLEVPVNNEAVSLSKWSIAYLEGKLFVTGVN